MTWESLQIAWPALAILSYVLVASVLHVLASHYRHAIQIHEHIRAVRRLRNEYLSDTAAKQQEA